MNTYQQGYVPARFQSGTWGLLMAALITWKDPADTWDYTLDFKYAMPAGDSLVGVSSVTAQDASGNDVTQELILASPAPAVSGTTVVFWLQGGEFGQQYTVEAVAVTRQGRTYTGALNVSIVLQ